MAVSLKNENGIVRFFKWLWEGLERTLFLGVKFTFPSRFVSPLGFLGMLTFITFIILGITGALLMFYYEPILDRAWDSVERINDVIPYGFHLRNLHYHASNAMVFLALAHMYYQYFSGRYKIRNEILWVTGVILGTVTILEAFSGYDILYNERAELAISIAVSLTNSIPIMGPQIASAVFGAGFADFVLRFYALHVFILPIVMLGLMAVHFPRFLVFDVPMVMMISGAIFITGGVFPVELGTKFEPQSPPGVTVPEWYLTGLYAFLRTQFDKFVTGVLWPSLLIGSLLLIPFIDRYKRFSWRDRPLITAFGITSLAQILVTTYWGFYIDPDIQKSLTERLVIDPIMFYSVMLLLVPLSFGFTYMMIKLARHSDYKKKMEAAKRKTKGETRRGISIPENWSWILLVVLLIFQVYLNISAYYASIAGFRNVELFLVGVLLITFAAIFHIYRYASQQAKSRPEEPKTPGEEEKPVTLKPIVVEVRQSVETQTSNPGDGASGVKATTTTQTPQTPTPPPTPPTTTTQTAIGVAKTKEEGK